MFKQRPTFLKVYVIPVLLLNIALGGWSIVAAHAACGVSISLGYAAIVTVGLYLYLLYLGRYLSSSSGNRGRGEKRSPGQ